MRANHAVMVAVMFVWMVRAAAFAIGAEETGIDVEGIWLGVLTVKTAELRLVFKISKKPDGSLQSTLDIIEAGARGITTDTTTFEDGDMSISIGRIKGVYHGKMGEDGSTIAGTWTQMGDSFPLTLRRVEKEPESIRRPQEPKRPFPYKEEEVSYENEEAGVTLTGTLTIPRSADPVPAVVLISGSGPQDRNETILGHKPFLVLADHLTRRGIAVLRADDRGIEKIADYEGFTAFLQATSKDFAEDALASVTYLRGRKEIYPRKIGLIGHSEGGIIAAMAAAKSADVAFVVMMAGPGQPMDELIHSQSELILRAAGASDKLLLWQRDVLESIFELLANEKDDAAARERIHKINEVAKARLTEQERQWVDSLGFTPEADVRMMASPWFRYLIEYDPMKVLVNVKCPVLAVIGEKDVQVPPDDNLRAIEQALVAGGNPDYACRKLPNLNHLFQTCETGALSEYARIEETMAPSALRLVTDWIKARTGGLPDY